MYVSLLPKTQLTSSQRHMQCHAWHHLVHSASSGWSQGLASQGAAETGTAAAAAGPVGEVTAAAAGICASVSTAHRARSNILLGWVLLLPALPAQNSRQKLCSESQAGSDKCCRLCLIYMQLTPLLDSPGRLLLLLLMGALSSPTTAAVRGVLPRVRQYASSTAPLQQQPNR